MTQLPWNIRNEFSQTLERWWWHLFWLQILISLPIWAKWPFFLEAFFTPMAFLEYDLFYTSNIQRRVLYWCDLMKYLFNIVMCQDTSEPTCFKLGMMLDTPKLNSLIPVWMTLMFTQGHRVTGKLELAQSICRKVALSNSNVHDGWLCRGDDCEEVL